MNKKKNKLAPDLVQGFGMANQVVVIGTGHTKFGELWDKSIQDLLFESQNEALESAGIRATDVDEIVVGNMSSEVLSGQSFLGAVAADVLGVSVPSYQVNAACASGGVALRAGVMAIESGRAQVVLISGVEKMTDIQSDRVSAAMMSAGHAETEAFVGATIPGLFALITRAYMNKFDITRRDLAQVSVKNHAHGLLNTLAHLRKKISIEDVLDSPIIADPLTLLDCSPISDGAASLVLCSLEYAQKLGKPYVSVLASAMATDCLSLAGRSDITTFKATVQAAQVAYKMAGITVKDIDVLEVHDAFSSAEFMALEDLGFFAPGTAAQATIAGVTSFTGKLSVNISGGLKAKGHPVGATGVAQAVEIVRQLFGQCGQRQVPGAKLGLTHNVGGLGTTVVVHIFKKS
ncbi:MAG: thiolase domain-containing protein [bacterium]